MFHIAEGVFFLSFLFLKHSQQAKRSFQLSLGRLEFQEHKEEETWKLSGGRTERQGVLFLTLNCSIALFSQT